ncbi:putative toxin-antitoxin system toxin component, PIN family [Dyadobacter psychrotolerans]|uniref:Putative toxin-antitoxin system toxin component, PIN family n=1 Tax=Dyadobacter psychrotolerans TaxID=2541721 RepID=A0A4R5DVE6_9BACT|nr:putative toxin-antitoxin system toxin component, PIN family [Dyadobacter psychrotolerans]TDE18512.1 putative toxin-antitoxin system toxin component, PIN family [Dyadobacter psychrotolerans]
MIRVVIDTNCLRASIPPKSPFYQLYLDFRSEKFEWFVSNEILLEYDEIRTKTYSQKTSQFILHQLAIAPNVVFTEPAFKWNLIINDPDDNKFSDLAISSNCNYLVSNDSDFNIFKSIEFPKLTVIDLESFLAIIK